MNSETFAKANARISPRRRRCFHDQCYLCIIITCRGIEDIGCRPFALVGHSFGGLVIKALVNAMKTRSTSEAGESNALNSDAIDRANKFLQNLKGIVFYSVPHSGADADALARYFKFQGLSTMVKDLRPFSRKMAKMSVLTEDAVYKKGVIIFAFGEGKPTFSNKVCPSLSLHQDSRLIGVG
jgi:triacylglycerol esterase/lipase EstA (alpha/beta hydrolase family)